MNKRNKILVLLMVFGIIIALLGSTFAYLSWRSSADQETVIDFSIGGDFSCAANGGGNLDEGDATLLPTYVNEESSANYIKREVKITPTINVEGQTIYMDLWLDIKELGEGLTNSQNLRYAFTTSSTSNTEGVVSTGNFYGKVAGDKINLLNGKDYADSNVDTYYLWIWLDAAQTDASTMNQAFKVSLNGSCSEGMSEGVFEVTSIKNNYQVVNVTAVNSSNKIVSYAITNTETQPVNNISDNIAASPLVNKNTNNGITLLADSTSWIDIPDSEQGKIYNLEYTVNNAGTYYFWFKDDNGKIINKSLNISKVDTTGPKCVWSNISKNNLDEGDSATISLLCTDSETGMVSKDLVVSDFTISNNIITISKVEKSNITNGYKYTLTVVGGNTSGETTITLPKDKLSDTVNNLNTETVSGTILVSTVKTYAITYKDVGDTEFSGVHGDNYPLTYTTGSTTTLVNPTKTGYTFVGWYLAQDGSGNTITKIDGSQTGELVLYAKWTANTYKINFNSNIFSAYTKTINGLTITYDYETSYLTINGTPTTNWFEFPDLTGLSFTEGDTYTYKSTYISGSFAKANDTDSTIGVNVKKSSGDNVSTRNYTVLRHITSGSTTNTLTINSSGASEGSGLRYYLWFATPADWTFTNYKIKVEFTKNDTTNVTYNSTYGTLPTPTRTGYTFDGWYTGENGTGTKVTSTDKVSITSDQTLYAKWTVNTYKVNFDGNMYSTTTRTVNGLTITYDSTNSYLTINGTPTTTGYNLNHISGLTFTENDKYNLTLSYVSGTVTNSGTGSGSTGVDVETTSLANASTRNYISSSYITSGSATRTLTINSAGASEGAGFRLWLWFATPADWTFTNYKVKVNLTKSETANVTYGNTYGTLPTPKRVGFIFNGWYTGEKGTGTKVNSGDTVTITKDTTLYAKWTANTYTISFNGNMFSTTSRTLNGLTFTYDYDNSYLTINGTPTNTSTLLTNFTGLDLTSGDKYTMTLNYISGTYAYTGTGSASFVADVANSAGTGNLATRNYFSAAYPTSGSKTGTLTASDLAGTDGSGFRYWMWATTPASQTFTNYKMKVNITKNDTKKVTYNSAYGALPIPKRAGFTFDGWYTGEKGTGTKITDTSIVSANYNQTFYAKWKDNVLPYGTASLSIASGKFTLKLSNQGDAGSGLTGTYGFALTTNSNCSAATYTNQTGVSKDYTGSYTNGTTYYGCIKLTDKAGNIAYLSSAGVKYSYTNVNQQYTTAGEQTYTVPDTGTYKLEVWGAQGGSTTYSSKTYRGGYGGYSVGSISLTKGQKLYINVGGAGKGGASSSTFTGGYNGGGAITHTNGSDHYHASGGGATHIATVSGLLSTLSSKTSNILIVAGGGGGGYVHTYSTDYTSIGGEGGGIKGTDSTTAASNGKQGLGGTQTAGGKYKGSSETTSTIFGSFGKGGTPSASWGSAGGGGYYGGGASYGETSSNGNTGGGGGSGYIGNSSLTNKAMYCYNCTTSTATATKTNTTTKVSSTPTANYAKSGNGAARITATITTNVTSLVLTYNNNGGSGCYSKSIVKGGTYGTLCTPVRDGYSFDGWYTAATDGTKITSSTSVTVTANQTIYAHWIASTSPVITFSPDGNSSYVKGNITSTINVSKGSNDLNSSTLKYIYSLSNNVSPSVEFISGNSYSLNSATGKYYLIAQACDVNGKCTKKISSPFYVDNTKPTGTIDLTTENNTVIATISASDVGSGIRNYGYLITTASSCPTSGYTTSSNAKYAFNLSSSGTYNVCAKITDKAGNYLIINKTINIDKIELTYSLLSSNYKCANKSVGSNPYITYTGNCKVIGDGNENWRIKFLTSGDLTFSQAASVDIFLVGGGGGGESSGGGGGYTKTEKEVAITANTTYSITIGSGGTAGNWSSVKCTDGTESSFNGTYVAAGGYCGHGVSYYFGWYGGNGGSGGGATINNYGYDGDDGASNGGSDGSAYGQKDKAGPNGEAGTTCEFGEETVVDGAIGCYCPNVATWTNCLYSGGGGGGGNSNGSNQGSGGLGGGGAATVNGTANTGGGGGGVRQNSSQTGGAGGSGIVILRNSERHGESIAVSYKCSNISNGTSPYSINYTGNCEAVNEGNNNWKIKFLTSGTLTTTKNINIDAFLVGGGGAGSSSCYTTGGGGGYTLTKKSISITQGTSYPIVIGAGASTASGTGETTTAFSQSAAGGKGGIAASYCGSGGGAAGGAGGSGGGDSDSSGGTNGGNGGSTTSAGQGTTTCEFGEQVSGSTNCACSSSTWTDCLYSGGGAGMNGTGGLGGGSNLGKIATPNTGGGGGGSGGIGGSGVVVIRNYR